MKMKKPSKNRSNRSGLNLETKIWMHWPIEYRHPRKGSASESPNSAVFVVIYPRQTLGRAPWPYCCRHRESRAGPRQTIKPDSKEKRRDTCCQESLRSRKKAFFYPILATKS